MITTARLTITTEPIEAINVWLDDYTQMVSDIGNAVTREVEPQMLNELQDTPPKVKYPIEWTSEKQRRAFFATKGFGRGIPTKRTGKLQGGWKIVAVVANGQYRMVVSNPTSYLPYVVGSINFKSSRQALEPMQRFHKNTGWQPVQPTIEFWFKVAQEEFTKRHNQELGEFTQSLRVTRRSTRS